MLVCTKEVNNQQRLFKNNILHDEAANYVPTDEEFEEFSQVYFQVNSGEMVQNVNENNAELTGDNNINESTNFFFNAHNDDEVIMYHLEAEADKMRKIQIYFSGDDTIVENCVGGLERVDAASSKYSKNFGLGGKC